MEISDTDFNFFREFLFKTSGYHLQDDKRYLLRSRLDDVLKTHKIPTVQNLVKALQYKKDRDIERDTIECMTVNETFFFRDKIPFDAFEEHIIPKLVTWPYARPYRIWSAACSTGQEAYSIAILLEDNKHKFPNTRYEIIATDINQRVLAQARDGHYTDLEVNRGLSEWYRDKYFTKDGSQWRIHDSLKQHLQFRHLNLHDSYISLPGQFDFVMLRNVLIYFSQTMKDNVLHKMADKMHPDAYLLLGAAEGIYDPDHLFQRCTMIKGLYKIAN